MTASPVEGAKVAGAGSLGTIAGTFTAIRVGELCIVGVGWVDAAGTITCTVADSLGQAYTAIPLGKIRNATNTYATQLFYLVSRQRADATVTVTATFSTATTFRNLAIERYVSNQGPWDRDPFDQNAGTTGSGTALSSGNMTPSATNVKPVVIGWGSHNSGTLTAAGSFTARQGNATDTMLEDLFQTAPATVAATETASGADLWTMIGAVFFDAIGSSGPPPQPPPDLLNALAALSFASTGERQVGPQGSSVTATAIAGAVATSVVGHVAVRPAMSAAGGVATAVASKVVAVTGRCAGGAAATGVAKKVVADSGRACAGAISTAVERKVAPQVGGSFAGAVSTAVERKVAPTVGRACAGAVATAVGVKKVPVAGQTTAGAICTGVESSATSRAVVAACTAGAAATAVAKKLTACQATATAGAAGTAVARKVMATSAAVLAGAATTGVARKRSVSPAASLCGVACTAAVVKKSTPRAATFAAAATYIAAIPPPSPTWPPIVTESIAGGVTTSTHDVEDLAWLTTSATQLPYVTRSTAQPASSRTPP